MLIRKRQYRNSQVSIVEVGNGDGFLSIYFFFFFGIKIVRVGGNNLRSVYRLETHILCFFGLSLTVIKNMI